MRITVVYTGFSPVRPMNPALLAENLAVKGQGKSAAEVLDTGQTLALEEQRLSAEDFQILSKGTGWHPKVITKLLAIGRDKRLVPLQKQLPSTYSAIYPFTTLSDAELNLAVSEGICRPDSASREILDWIKVKRLDGMDLPESIGFVGTSIEPLTKERKAALLGALQQTALTFGINLVEGAVSVNTRKATKASREAVGERLYQQLLKELNPVFAIVSDEIRKEFELNVIDDLAAGEIRTLTGVLIRLSGSSEGMWEKYGAMYCYKIAIEYNKTESRSLRFNYRKRLLEVKNKHSHLNELVADLLNQMN